MDIAAAKLSHALRKESFGPGGGGTQVRSYAEVRSPSDRTFDDDLSNR
jgi:hypothetical protein